ncbi:lipoyl octanoyl transferase [Fusarium longipes]|uniref:lipoyl(octanoyl) transferase n=1 Tax=Fusarium longipes TaxID=694270 RepID=A0A395RH97_9HYPO|nr:lipoyl octanoyl transferase [Fusarium longipes]
MWLIKAAPSSGILSTLFRSGAGVTSGCVSAYRWSSSSAVGQPSLKLLTHQHLTGSGSEAFVSYDTAHTAQEELRSQFLQWKGLTDEEKRGKVPRAHLISFEPTPTLTLGRRQPPLTPAQASRFRAPLSVSLPNRRSPVPERTFTPDVRQTSRGGLTTYHGPGQLVLWPVLDMHSPLFTHYSVMSYASHLEATTRRLLADLFGLETYTTRDEPGVWVYTSAGQPERKIAAMGVHHRRHVTALGIAVNIDVPVEGSEDSNPWARFVPCGLEGKLVTSVATELKGNGDISRLEGWDMASLATRWATMFDEGLVDVTKRDVDGEASIKLRRAAL